ncbi:hypothetical protein GA0115249_11031, partial [Streptomyces sp. PpalLS-921]
SREALRHSVTRTEKQGLTSGYGRDADGNLCVILRHLRHAVTQPVTHR